MGSVAVRKGDRFEALLKLGGFESLLHEKGARNHPLSEAAKKLNRVKSLTRTCVEHVFGCMIMSMGGKLTRKIGINGNEAWWGAKNLTFNFFRYLQRSLQKTAPAWIPLGSLSITAAFIISCHRFLLLFHRFGDFHVRSTSAK